MQSAAQKEIDGGFDGRRGGRRPGQGTQLRAGHELADEGLGQGLGGEGTQSRSPGGEEVGHDGHRPLMPRRPDRLGEDRKALALGDHQPVEGQDARRQRRRQKRLGQPDQRGPQRAAGVQRREGRGQGVALALDRGNEEPGFAAIGQDIAPRASGAGDKRLDRDGVIALIEEHFGRDVAQPFQTGGTLGRRAFGGLDHGHLDLVPIGTKYRKPRQLGHFVPARQRDHAEPPSARTRLRSAMRHARPKPREQRLCKDDRLNKSDGEVAALRP